MSLKLSYNVVHMKISHVFHMVTANGLQQGIVSCMKYFSYLSVKSNQYPNRIEMVKNGMVKLF